MFDAPKNEIHFLLLDTIHGILDYTIFWIHTGLFFLFVLSSFEMFETNRN